MRTAYEDLKEAVPPEADLHRLRLLDQLWNEQKAKSKRMKALDAESLPKRVQILHEVQEVQANKM